MIIEAIVTTINLDGSTNVAPMGPQIESDFSRFDLKPFNTSTTFVNLQRTHCGVLHITDDSLLIAKAAIGQLDFDKIETISAESVHGSVIAGCVAWHEFEVDYVDETANRVLLKCRTVHSGYRKSWQGFNRAKHAILEAAILATRLSFIPIEEIALQFERLETIVKKTGGPQEFEAFELLHSFVEDYSVSKS